MVEERYTREVATALAMLKTDEARAKAEYILGNIKTIVVKYGNTTTGQFVKSSCDNWKNWIQSNEKSSQTPLAQS